MMMIFKSFSSQYYLSKLPLEVVPILLSFQEAKVSVCSIYQQHMTIPNLSMCKL